MCTVECVRGAVLCCDPTAELALNTASGTQVLVHGIPLGPGREVK